MNRLKKWLVEQYLPASAREVLMEENERLRKELDATRSEPAARGAGRSPTACGRAAGAGCG